MNNKRIVFMTFSVIALVASAPLALMVAEASSNSYNNDMDEIANYLLYAAPLLIGAASGVVALVLKNIANGLWKISPAIVGAIVGVVAFLSYALALSVGAEYFGRGSFGETFHVFGGVGILLFGWIPLVFGAFSGWLSQKIIDKNA